MNSESFVRFIKDYSVPISIFFVCLVLSICVWILFDPAGGHPCRTTIDANGSVVMSPTSVCGVYRCTLGRTLVQNTGYGVIQVLRHDGSFVQCRVTNDDKQ